jgi:hypothetical protein
MGDRIWADWEQTQSAQGLALQKPLRAPGVGALPVNNKVAPVCEN